jgi:hypothetical protein
VGGRVEGMLCLLIGVRSIPGIKSRHKNCPSHMSHDLIMYWGRHSPKDLLKLEGCCPKMGTQYRGPKNLKRIIIVGLPQHKAQDFLHKSIFHTWKPFLYVEGPFNSWKDLPRKEVLSNIEKQTLQCFTFKFTRAFSLSCSKSPCNGKLHLLKAINMWKHGKLCQEISLSKISFKNIIVL